MIAILSIRTPSLQLVSCPAVQPLSLVLTFCTCKCSFPHIPFLEIEGEAQCRYHCWGIRFGTMIVYGSGLMGTKRWVVWRVDWRCDFFLFSLFAVGECVRFARNNKVEPYSHTCLGKIYSPENPLTTQKLQTNHVTPQYLPKIPKHNWQSITMSPKTWIWYFNALFHPRSWTKNAWCGRGPTFHMLCWDPSV